MRKLFIRMGTLATHANVMEQEREQCNEIYEVRASVLLALEFSQNPWNNSLMHYHIFITKKDTKSVWKSIERIDV